MVLPTTETLPTGEPIDLLSADQASSVFLTAQINALETVHAAIPDIIAGSKLMARAIEAGRPLTYAAAGSSGLMALADACELPGTFGVSPDQIRIFMAGGIPTGSHMPGDTEDDTDEAAKICKDTSKGDVFVILSASGTTPYALEIAQQARTCGAQIIAVANNPDTPLLNAADVAVCLKTPPEVIAGSTRLGAGSAQKTALNMMSSLMGIKLGHVFQGQMVNVVADNAKLIARAGGIVARTAEVTDKAARAALRQTQGNPKAAILVAKGTTVDQANALLTLHNGHLMPSIQSLNETD